MRALACALETALVQARDFLTGRNRYHPEKHYMRGPGPKTRAKQEALARARDAGAQPWSGEIEPARA
ncbi:MAG TPA: hypothetical protein VM434_11175 [Beijerinckiaceae bacterium]|nr:hypothetical protein [Beijerinckiaceae bacterium]